MSRGRARRRSSADQPLGKAAWLTIGVLAIALTGFWVVTHRADMGSWAGDMKVQCQARYAKALTARDTVAVDLTHPEYNQGGFRGALYKHEAISCGELRARDWKLP